MNEDPYKAREKALPKWARQELARLRTRAADAERRLVAAQMNSPSSIYVPNSLHPDERLNIQSDRVSFDTASAVFTVALCHYDAHSLEVHCQVGVGGGLVIRPVVGNEIRLSVVHK